MQLQQQMGSSKPSDVNSLQQLLRSFKYWKYWFALCVGCIRFMASAAAEWRLSVSSST
jgi:hypothetical protein